MKWVRAKVKSRKGRILECRLLVPTQPKIRMEFSKKAVIGITVFCMGCVTANYVLAFREATNVNEAVTISLITTILGTVIGYFVKARSENIRKIEKSNCDEESDNNV